MTTFLIDNILQPEFGTPKRSQESLATESGKLTCISSVDNLESGSKGKVENILKGNMDSIPSPSPSVKIQILGGKFFVVNKLLESKTLLTLPSNVLPDYLK